MGNCLRTAARGSGVPHIVTTLLQYANSVRAESRLQRQYIGVPLMVHARGIRCFCDIHTVINNVDDHLQDNSDNPAATGTTGRKPWLTICKYNRWRHRTQRPLPGSYRVGVAAEHAERIHDTGFC